MRHQRERARVGSGRIFRLALRVKNAREIVVRLGVIGVERDDALVSARSLVKFARAFERQRIKKQFVDLTACAIRCAHRARRAMLERGAAFFAVHRPSFL